MCKSIHISVSALNGLSRFNAHLNSSIKDFNDYGCNDALKAALRSVKPKE
ncbi:hypothetical protein PVK63_10255 [Aliivibrio sp. S2TY2]|nr:MULTISPECIES: hypothetical protein [unclassified Aliivibrio]MDD9175254.1 hypothetical protein [Aliivibrio sp. S3TY1]MDD9192333.1 hypothetical protein [Aliivibrio sp. S2TY2]